ncbi:hypothetical protein [Rhizobium rosettiformans]|uniref:hypothetical protein n=1 Tax=Rhizobium rosettiformans TaxID=1368430 RepID=UPI002856EEF9|nr:hypothetical protein [Rhizobium rosettiformans]MDR7027247.1 hypothetical protein [Rhizobium rosettiformans]MDR7065368.1 hypothetical protein [Rhizobium rosettiformans]
MGSNFPSFTDRAVTEEAVDQFAAPIGHLIIHFAFADQVLDFLLIELFEAGLKRGVETSMPHQLGHKIEIVRKCHRLDPRLNAAAKSIDDALDTIKRWSDVRNALAHGALTHFDDSSEPTLVMGRLRYDKKTSKFGYLDQPVTLADIGQAVDQVSDAVAALHRVVALLMRSDP